MRFTKDGVTVEGSTSSQLVGIVTDSYNIASPTASMSVTIICFPFEARAISVCEDQLLQCSCRQARGTGTCFPVPRDDKYGAYVLPYLTVGQTSNSSSAASYVCIAGLYMFDSTSRSTSVWAVISRGSSRRLIYANRIPCRNAPSLFLATVRGRTRRSQK